MRWIAPMCAALVVFLSCPAPVLGQEAAPQTVAQAAPPPVDWTIGIGATASIDVVGAGGTILRHAYGLVLGEPARVTMRLTDLAGAEKAVVTFRDGRKIEASAVSTSDPIQDIAILATTAPLPAPPDPAPAIKWRPNAKVIVLPGPDMGDAVQNQTVNEPFELGTIRVVPLTGDLPGGLAVMDVQGKWIGLTGRIEDVSGTFAYLTSSEQIIPVIFGEAAGKPISKLAVTPPDWQSPREATGMLVRAVLRSFQKPAEAGPYFDLALERDRGMPDIYYWMGKNAFRQQKYAEAEGQFREAIRLKPGYVMAYHMAGAAANQQGHYDVALDLYDQGLKINPTNVMTMTSKAGALYNLGRIPESIDVLKKAIEIDPTFALAIHNLGVTYSSMGDLTDAEAMYQKLLPLDRYLAKALRDRLDGQ